MQSSQRTREDAARSGSAAWAAFVIGVALSGFFDGILLHQVLQWHHLLSLVPGDTFDDLRTQVYADGLFHIAVYIVAATGLTLLWRARRDLAEAGAGRRVIGYALMGFGVWNIVDVGFFHWILGIHRIRVGVPDPLLYDLAWLIGLGGIVVLAGWAVARRKRPALPGGRGGTRTAATLAALLVLAVPVANLPVPSGGTLVLFRPGLGPAGAINAVVAAGARIVLIDPEGGFALIAMGEGARPLSLYRSGALLVSRSPALAGCLALTRIA